MSSFSEIKLNISGDAIRTYIDSVFGYLDGFVPIRAFAEKGTRSQKPYTEYRPVAEAAGRLIALAPQAADKQRAVYVVPGTVVTADRARSDDIVQTGVLLVDIDHGDIAAKRDHLVRHLGTPSLVIGSGGQTEDGQHKLHLYWRLTEPAIGDALIRVAALRAEIARKAWGDPSFGSLHQPIRVPGTIHGKNGRKTLVRLIEETGQEHDLEDLAEAIGAMPTLEVPGQERKGPANATGRPGAKDLATRTVREGGVDGTTRFEALSTVIGHWIRNIRTGRCSLDEAWEAVVGHNAAMIVPPWPESRLAREFDAILKRDIERNGPRTFRHDPLTDADAGTNSFAPDLSDDALADALVSANRTRWRFTPAWGHWHRWNGRCWGRDETGYIRELARQTARSRATALEKPGEARRVASHKTISAMLSIASCDPRLALRADDWDTHPLLLNTPTGVVDLETGEILSHDPALHLSQITRASPGSGCDGWTRFLDEITDGDSDLIAYLRRLCGYLLTGDISEQVFVFLQGNGANGKSVFLSTVSAILGDYAATATQATFMASNNDRHLSELAGLRAARLVTVPETERGRAWAEARIKAVTGGERIRANFMRQDHFEFVPQFKLIVAGNHRPEMGEVGEAMRRRLHLVPFEVTIPPDRRNKDLSKKLLAEADGILGWMIEGCTEWRRIGLAPPARVRDASEAYLAEEDMIGHWIEQYCVVKPQMRQAARDLYASWTAYAREVGADPGSQKSLGAALRQRGLRATKVVGRRGWEGIALLGPDSSEGS